MQPHLPSPSLPSHPSAYNDYTNFQKSIPWWHDLDPYVQAELALSDNDMLPPRCDIAVIGAGVAGLSAALSAREVGAEVVVLEKAERLGYGATGRNAGILSAGVNMSLSALPTDSPGFKLWGETTQLLLSLVNEARQPGSSLSAALTGAISMAESKNAARLLVHEAKARNAAGLQAELWTPTQVQDATQGRLNVQQVVSALWLPDEGRIHPLTLLAHLAKLARQAGIQIIGRTIVDSYEETTTGEQGHHWHITHSGGRRLNARALISAIGPTAKPNARIYALAFEADLPDDFPLFWDASPFTYADFRPGNGRLGVSGGRYGRAGVTRHDSGYHLRLAKAARRWLPELAAQEPTYRWAVDLAVTPDMIPEVRSLGSLAPGMSIQGLGSLGVLSGIVLGRRAGRMVAQDIQKV
jgi:glycine/D-amino acid oxidase-like deaminating enzyme